MANTDTSTEADAVIHAHTTKKVTTDSSDDTPTDPVTRATPAAPLPSAATSRAPRRSWTPADDSKLREALHKHGKNWVALAAMVPGRKNHQCRHRWISQLGPTNVKNTAKWSAEEDAKLK
jgi:hypothetical protein